MSSCRTCPWFDGFPHDASLEQHTSGKELLQSATAGCLVCAIFCDALKLIHGDAPDGGAQAQCTTARDKHGLLMRERLHTIIMEGRKGTYFMLADTLCLPYAS
jgi:hypothetical protein